MGGRSSSSNQTKTTTEVTTGSVGFDGSNDGLILSGLRNSNVNVTTTDHNAIDKALRAMSDSNALNVDLSKFAISESTAISKALGSQALVASEKATTQVMDIIGNLSLNSDAGTAQTVSKYMALSAVAVVVAFAISRGKK
jgi:tellurite resistance protein